MDQRIPGPFESFSSGKVATSMPRPLQRFYKAEPMALGITQILTGILEIAFGAVLAFTDHYGFIDIMLQTPVWSGILYIISGSLSVAAAKNPKMSLVMWTYLGIIGPVMELGLMQRNPSHTDAGTWDVQMKGMLGMNILSAVAAGIVIGISTTSIMFEGSRGRGYACAHSSNNTKAIQSCRILVTIPYSTMYSTVAFLLMLTVLEFLIAIVSSAFGCASLCRDSYSETTIVIFQNAAEASPPPPAPAP